MFKTHTINTLRSKTSKLTLLPSPVLQFFPPVASTPPSCVPLLPCIPSNTQRILSDHQFTTNLASQVVKESSKSRQKWEEQLEQVKPVTSYWPKYEMRFTQSCRRLRQRVQKEVDRRKRFRKLRRRNARSQKNLKAYRPRILRSMSPNLRAKSKFTVRK